MTSPKTAKACMSEENSFNVAFTSQSVTPSHISLIVSLWYGLSGQSWLFESISCSRQINLSINKFPYNAKNTPVCDTHTQNMQVLNLY